MTERELNKRWLKGKLKDFMYSEEFFNKILDLCSEQYIEGLEQSSFDKRMLEVENEQLKAELELYKGALHKENEATHRANNLEDKITEARSWIEEYKTEWTSDDEIVNDMNVLLQIL